MCFFIHDLEELFNCDSNGNDGNTVTRIPNTKNIFVNFIYWDRAITHTLKCAILKGSFESIETYQIEINLSKNKGKNEREIASLYFMDQ